ncbi:MAG: hypothetical protein CMJ81_23115 [Planctomycetaceae bacterium]|nr:hypothetical protein [Planctomycetaceae bacterium]MBP61567.1 hypothetical protein [Planctomycetaceae bacterium]
MTPSTSLDWNPIFGNALLVFIALLVLVALLGLSPEFRKISPRRRVILVILRCAVILLVFCALVRPQWVITEEQRDPATLIVLLDRSRSMSVTDTADGKSRWQALRSAVARVEPQLQELGEELQIKVYTFDASAERATWVDGSLSLEESADGLQSDIGSALGQTVRKEVGHRLMGVVLFSDGAQRAYEPRVELREAARELKRLGYPLYTVSFGLPREKSQAKDVAIENLQDHYSVFVKNELLVRSAVRVQGFANQALRVELFWEDEHGHWEFVEGKDVQANQDGELLDVLFTHAPQRAGRFRLAIRVESQAGELVLSNNELTAYVTVREGGLKLLYLYGSLVGEQRSLRTTLEESPEMQADCMWINHGFREKWPVRVEEMSGQQHDVYILESVHAEALGEQYLKQIVADVNEEGRGLLMLGGIYSFGGGAYHGTDLAEALPVKVARFERQDFDAPVRDDLHVEGPLQMRAKFPNFITRLGGSKKDNHQVWQQLHPLDGANKVEGKVASVVLAESSDGIPLLVSGQYGSGRTLVFAGDTSWKWKTHGHDKEYRRFWRQVILWLAQRDQVEDEEIRIRLEHRRFPPAADVAFTVVATSAAGDPLEGVSFRAELVHPGGARDALRLANDGEVLAGRWHAATEPGEYTVEVVATRGTDRIGTARESFVIYDRDLELHDPSANPALMASLADLTQETGGRALAPEELPAMLENLADNLGALDVKVHKTWQFPGSEKVGWPFFLLVVTLLCSEWVLRKKWGLV